jgi:hypothetical protein
VITAFSLLCEVAATMASRWLLFHTGRHRRAHGGRDETLGQAWEARSESFLASRLLANLTAAAWVS